MKQKLEAGKYYHIWNFSSQMSGLFPEEKNFDFFIIRLQKYLLPICKVYAYCLLPGEFHVLMRFRSETTLIPFFLQSGKFERNKASENLRTALRKRQLLQMALNGQQDNLRGLLEIEGLIDRDGLEKRLKFNVSIQISRLLADHLGNFFNSYAKALNKQQQRRGSIFLKTFRRKRITSEKYRRNLVHWFHLLPALKDCCQDHQLWRYTSLSDLKSTSPTFLCRNEVISWFGGNRAFDAVKTAA